MISISNRHSSTLVLIVLGAAMLLISSAHTAQAQDVRSLHRIQVSQSGEVCHYQIQDQTNQDLFRITPLGAVLFQTKGDVKVRIDVEDAEAEGRSPIPGMAGAKRADIDRDKPIQSLAVRDRRGMSTEHRVHIQCCTSRGLFGCRWSDAEPMPSSQEVGALMPPVPVDQAALRGPMATDPVFFPGAEKPLPTGGPVMKIEE